MTLLQKMRQKGNYIRIGLAALALMGKVYADDIAKGCKSSPKADSDFQLDTRFSLAKSENGTTTYANTNIGKLWPGTGPGWWAYIIASYKSISGGRYGTGDITIGAGPRIVNANQTLNFLPHYSVTLPSGQISNGRFDQLVGVLFTGKTIDSMFEADGNFQYKAAGQKNGVKQPNEFYAGVVAGGGSPKFRGVAGITYTKRDNGDFLTTEKVVLRYTPNPKKPTWHFEVAYEKSIASRNMNKDWNIAIYARHNLPRKTANR